MKALSTLHLVQYSFWDYETFNLKLGGTAFLGPNGAGKTSLVDAVQVALVGGHGNHMHFNTQSVHKDNRSIRDYALGTMRSGEGGQDVINRKRDEALSYITLVFEGETPADVVSAGICVHSLASEKTHRTLGLYILPGVKLKLENHLGALDNGAKAPLDWPTFEALARKLAKQEGRTPTLTNKPETYLDELLHALQHSGRSIDREKFLRSLAQSLRLKGISSVNDFLRGYLVDAQPIDKQGTLKHIRTVRALGKQIQEVKEQIVRLNDIDAKFTTVANHYVTRANASAVKAQLLLEGADTRVGELESRKASLEEEIEQLKGVIASLEKEDELLSKSHDDLLRSYSSDPAMQDAEQNQRLREAYQVNVNELKSSVDRLVLDLRTALNTAAEVLEVSENDGAPAVFALLKRFDSGAKNGTHPGLAEMKEGLDVLKSLSSTIDAILQENANKHDTAARQLQAATAKVQVARKGMRLSDDDVAVAMSLFKQNGIESRTVASLVKVRDIRWQPAIESFLGRNRFSVVVDAGRESDAVRLLRALNKPLYDVTVVQPNHLKENIGSSDEPHSVAELLISENKVALAYLRRIFGRMRQVETEAELEKYDRALTVDGMLSANGGTRRIRLISQTDCALGAEVTAADMARLTEDFQFATTEENRAKQRFDQSKEASEKVRRTIRDTTVDKYSHAVTTLSVAQASLSSVPEKDISALPEHLSNIKSRMESTKVASEEVKTKLHKAIGDKGKLQEIQKTTAENFEHAKASLEQAKHNHIRAIADVDYDNDRALKLYDYASGLAASDGPEEALKHLQDTANQANSKLVNAESTAKSEFTFYINEMSINLVDERSDWRKASTWVKNHVQKLTESTLVEYESEACAAREAANQSFRADVSFRMREAIKRVEHDIHDLNGILKVCPEFTGGEKYKFVAEPALAHKGLYDLIQSSAFVETGTAPLFEAADDIQKTLIGFLEACETGEGKANNPLEDYRLLFNFDLEIRVGDKKVDRLSKRLGVGSNGEHLVPFYVIAGACLANAYRMKAGELHNGAAVMIIDEAFHGFDAQNAFVTAKFLRSLGLQLVMAAPDADVGKLIPVLGSYYDLDRFGSDVFTEEILIKDGAESMFESDMPTRNPELVAKMVEQLSLAT
jgi:chromosome segregation protein